MNNLKEQYKSAKRVSVPLLAIESADPAASVNLVRECENGETSLVQWDIVRGFTSLNEAGQNCVQNMGNTENNPIGAMVAAKKLQKDGVLFVHLASRWLENSSFVQAVWNLRDQFKENYRMLILLGAGKLPVELKRDVVVIDEELPDRDQLESILLELVNSVDSELTRASLNFNRALDAVAGLSAFEAEQALAMSLRRDGIDLDELWERKRQMIGITPGLSVQKEKISFEQIGGCEQIKEFAAAICSGHNKPNAIVFIDEIEKSIAGQGDTSGVSQDQLSCLLSYMQDSEAAGMIFVGPPGAAKSAVAKATGNHAEIPTIQLDLGAAKGSLVGQSEAQLREALKVITAVGSGRSLWIATCNSISDLPLALRRRFTLGTFYFDLPNENERDIIWKIYRDKYDILITGGDVPTDDNGWTGAEIKQACEIAWRLECSIEKAATYIVPIAKSAPEQVEKLRNQATGRFLSASYPGMYQIDQDKSNGRKIKL